MSEAKNTLVIWTGDGGTLSDDELEAVLQLRCSKKFVGQLWRGEITELNIKRFCEACILDFFDKGVLKKKRRVLVRWGQATKNVDVRVVK